MNVRLVLVTVLALSVASAGTADADVVDWTAADATAETASGLLRGSAVSLMGTDVQVGILDGSFTGFAGPAFSPSLPQSDTIALAARAGASYEVRFAAPVTNPVLYLASLASRLEFPAGTTVTKLSGQDTFVVSGATVTGAAAGTGQNSDANGTVRLSGTYSIIRFAATPVAEAVNGDGFYLQIAAPSPSTSGGWGQGGVGVDVTRERERLAALQAAKAASVTTSGGAPSSLGALTASHTPWAQLPPSTTAALRNLGVTPTVYTSWQTARPLFSPTQALAWADLSLSQQKSATFLGLEASSWDALAAALSDTGGTTPVRGSVSAPRQVSPRGSA